MPNAESLYERALAILNKTLGEEHTDVAKCLDNYAALLKKARRAEDAGPLESRARAIRAKHSAGIRKAHGLSDDSDLLRTVSPLD